MHKMILEFEEGITIYACKCGTQQSLHDITRSCYIVAMRKSIIAASAEFPIRVEYNNYNKWKNHFRVM